MPEYFHEKELLSGSAASNLVIDKNSVTITTHDIGLYFEPFVDIANSNADEFATAIGKLAIPTGADEILWNYGVNTKRTPTYGGEVVQILSMFADKMNIKGTCRNYGEQRAIYEYFRKYIAYTTGASGLERQQKYLVFNYPARGWSFAIMVTGIEGMRMATKQAAPTWQITAEIVSENDRYALGENRTDRFADALSTPITRASQSVRVVTAKTNNTPKGASRNFRLLKGNDPYGDLMDYMDGGRGKVAENFDAMIASWVTGDIATVRNNPIADPVKSADEIYKEHFGSEVAIGGSATGSGGETGTTGGGPTATSPLSGTLEPELIAALASNAFVAVGKSDLAKSKATLIEAVKIAYGESGWNTRSINYNINGGINNVTYEDYIANYADVAPRTGSGDEASNPSFDLGIWQINNYWHPTEILEVCGQDTSGGYTEQRERAASSGCYQKLLDDAFINAKAMATIYAKNKSWSSWVAQGKAQYNSIDKEARAAVDRYLANPSSYDQQAVTGDLTGSGEEGVAGSAPPDLTNDIRKDACAWARWMHANKTQIKYVFGGGHGGEYSSARRTKPPSLPMGLDCSSSTSLCLMWAGADQVGVNSTHGMINFKRINREDCGPGDLIIYGSSESDTTHVCMVLERKGNTLVCFSHGGGTDADAADPSASPVILDDVNGAPGTYRDGSKRWYVRWPGVK